MGEIVSYTVFGTGAIVFPLLTLAYWRELRRREREAGEWSILAFSLVSAAAYLLNLGWMSGVMAGDWPGEALRWVAAGLAGLMVALAGGRWWAAGGVASLGLALRVASAPEASEALVWILAAGVAIPGALRLQGGHRRWVLGACAAVAAGAGLWLAHGSAWWSVLPDYALLALFGATLYYRERLVFFDVVIKQGALAAVAIPILAAISEQAGRQVFWAAPLVIASPWLASWLGRAVDRKRLGRRFTAGEAERQFWEALQGAGDEAGLLESAGAVASRLLLAPVRAVGEGDGVRLVVERRASGVPLLSDDLRLIHSLERTLAVVLENVRFRGVASEATGARAAAPAACKPGGTESAAGPDQSSFPVQCTELHRGFDS